MSKLTIAEKFFGGNLGLRIAVGLVAGVVWAAVAAAIAKTKPHLLLCLLISSIIFDRAMFFDIMQRMCT